MMRRPIGLCESTDGLVDRSKLELLGVRGEELSGGEDRGDSDPRATIATAAEGSASASVPEYWAARVRSEVEGSGLSFG